MGGHVTTAAIRKWKAIHLIPSTRNTRPRIVLPGTKGAFETANRQEYTIQEGSCFLLFPGVWHHYKPSYKQGGEEYWMGINGYDPRKLLRSGSFNKKNGSAYRFQRSIAAVLSTDAVQNQKRNTWLSLGNYRKALHILSLIYNSTLQKENKDDRLAYIPKAKFILSDTIAETIRMPALAKEFAVSYSKFRKGFRQVIGMAPFTVGPFPRYQY